MGGSESMSQLSSMKEILDVWNQTLIKEHRGKSLCDGDTKERKVCKDRDQASREYSRKKRELKRKTWPGKEDLDKLANGVVEEDKLTVPEAKKEKKKNCGPGNPRHDKKGRFSSKEDNTSWGLGGYGRSDGKCQSGKSQMKPGSNRRYITKHSCGSKTTGPKGGEGKHKYRCKNKKAIWEIDTQDNEWIKVKRSAFQRLVGTDLTCDDSNDINLFEDYMAEQESKDQKIKRYCQSKGLMSFKDFLIRTNAIELSQKGKLFDKPKKKK